MVDTQPNDVYKTTSADVMISMAEISPGTNPSNKFPKQVRFDSSLQKIELVPRGFCQLGLASF